MPAPGDEAYRRSTTHHGPKCFAFRINTRDSDDQEKRKVRVYSLIAISVFAYRPLWCLFSDQFLQGTVGFRLEPTVDEARIERDKAERTGENETAFAAQHYF